MSVALAVLVVDDNPMDNRLYRDVLEQHGYTVVAVANASAALTAIRRQRFDVALLDMLLPVRRGGKLDFGGVELLRTIKERDATTQVIAITGYGNRELAAEAMSEGAFDYITKDSETFNRLPGSVQIAGQRALALRADGGPRVEEHERAEKVLPSNLVADSAAMRQLIREAQSLAEIDRPLLIRGERGVGKELIARVVHLSSAYRQGPLVTVACDGLGTSLVELWGDALRPGSGFCAQAEGGTLLLKAVHELSFSQQKQLAPFVRERRYRPLHAEAPIASSLRVIATTSADLERLVQQGLFWRPLYDELVVGTLRVPPLRERRDKDDTVAIAGYLLHRHGLAEGLSPGATELLKAYDYPEGNITELEQVLRDAARRSRGGTIRPEHLPSRVQAAGELPLGPAAASAPVAERAPLTIRFIETDPPTLIWDGPAVGTTRSTLVPPFAPADLPTVLRALEAAQFRLGRGGPRLDDEERARMEALELLVDGEPALDIDRRVGTRLYQAIVADPEAKSALDSERRLAAQDGRPLSLVLRFPPEATALASLPWELTWAERQPLLLGHGGLASCVRHLDIPHPLPPPAPVRQQLRLLAVSPKQGVPEHWHSEERRLLLEALQPLIKQGALEVEYLRPARVRDLSMRLLNGPPVDVLQFYGHGNGRDNGPGLVLDDGELSASKFASLVGTIPLVVLYACRSAEIGRASMFTGIAPLLSAEGVSAVVAMQYSVRVEAANCFQSFLYSSLAAGDALQTAVAKGRQALYVEFPDSWYLPVVYIRSRHAQPVTLVRRA